MKNNDDIDKKERRFMYFVWGAGLFAIFSVLFVSTYVFYSVWPYRPYIDGEFLFILSIAIGFNLFMLYCFIKAIRIKRRKPCS